MTNTITGKEFVKLVRSGVDDFRDFGATEVLGFVWLDVDAYYRRKINLGSLVFKGKFSCGDSSLHTLDCGNAVFEERFYVEQLYTHNFHCNSATFNAGLYIDEATITGRFTCGSATFHDEFRIREGRFGSHRYERLYTEEDNKYHALRKSCFDIGFATFHRDFQCGYASFVNRFWCGCGEFNGIFDCGKAEFLLISCYEAHFKKGLLRENASFAFPVREMNARFF